MTQEIDYNKIFEKPEMDESNPTWRIGFYFLMWVVTGATAGGFWLNALNPTANILQITIGVIAGGILVCMFGIMVFIR
jgi:hypothetical protein